MSDNCAQFERLVIGGILQRPELASELDLSPAMFTSSVYEQAFTMIQTLQSSHEALDMFQLADKLESENTQTGWVSILGGAMKDCFSPRNTNLYADKLRDEYRARQAKEIAAALMNGVSSGGMDAIDAAVKALMDLGVSQKNYDMSLKDALNEAVDYIDKICQLDGVLAGVTSGLSGLDEILGGFHDADLCVIPARPSMGKTALLLNLALATDKPAGIISSEQPGMQIATRMVAMEGRLNANRLRNASQMTEDDWAAVTLSMSKLQDRNIWINDKSGISIAELVRQARAWKHHHDIGILYVDYIQRIKAMDTRIARHEQVGQVVMALKELARDLDIPVVALAQVNREVEKRGNKRPGMGDIKDSGTIEQEADTIITLYRDDVYDKDSKDKGTAELDVLKNRHGPTGFIRVTWLAECMRFENFSSIQDSWSGPSAA